MTKTDVFIQILLLFNLAALGLGWLRGWLVSRRSPHQRARIVASCVWALAIAVACQLVAYVYVRYVEPNWITVTHLRVRDDRLARALGRGRMVQVTDLHIEQFGWRERMMIWQVNRQHPDWIVITGDLINGREGWPIALQVIRRLKAARSVWVVPGNTDNYYISPEQFSRDLMGIGANVLRNSHAPLGETGVWLVGLDDPVERLANLSQALFGLDLRSLPPVILLAHAPNIMREAVEAHIPLVLVGHTHGGQLGIAWIRRFSAYAERGPYMSGRYQEGNTVLYVNRGIGTKMLPYRFLAAPEVAVVEFKTSRGTSGGLPSTYKRPQPIQGASPASAPLMSVPSVPAQATQPAEAPWGVGWESGLTKVFREPSMFQGHRSNPVQMALAKNEYESVQLVLLGGAQPTRVSVSVGPLSRSDGTASFPSDVVEVRQVGYVTTKTPGYPVTYVGDWPDPLPLANEVEVPAGRVQPVWITVGAPEWLPAGRYTGTITLKDTDGHVKEVTLEVRVWDFVLPHTPHLKTAFGFYRTRMVDAYREFVPSGVIWTGRTDELEQLYYLELLKHRLSPIMDADPMGERFADTLAFYRQLGLSAFGIGSHGGDYDNNWPTDPHELKHLMGWYRDAAQELREKHLLEQAYVYAYDEPHPEDPRAAQVMAELHRAAPQLRRLLVMHEALDPVRDAQWLKDVDILCLRITSYNPQHAQQFTRMGKEVWLYVSSPANPFPGLVIDYPAMASRILPWMCWKYGARGLLYWCVNFWKTNPWVNPANYVQDQNGNGSLLYPGPSGPVPSIRLEALRDGMEDYEYLYRLQELIQRAETRGGVEPTLLAQAKRLVAVEAPLIESLNRYTTDTERLLAHRRAVADTIEQLQLLVGR